MDLWDLEGPELRRDHTAKSPALCPFSLICNADDRNRRVEVCHALVLFLTGHLKIHGGITKLCILLKKSKSKMRVPRSLSASFFLEPISLVGMATSPILARDNKLP